MAAFTTGEYNSFGKPLGISDLRSPTPAAASIQPATSGVQPSSSQTAMPTFGYSLPNGSSVGMGDLGAASTNALQAQIAALQAQYGLDLAQLAALGGDIGARAEMLMAQLDRQEKVAYEGVISNVLQRGIFRSGITARDLSRVAADFADQRAMLELDKNAALRDIEARRGAANAAMNQGIGGTYGEIQAGNTETELAQLGAGGSPSALPDPNQASQGVGVGSVTTAPGGYVAPGNTSIQDFQNSLLPNLRAMLTEQDLLNMQQFYKEGLPQDVVSGMLQRLTAMANSQ